LRRTIAEGQRECAARRSGRSQQRALIRVKGDRDRSNARRQREPGRAVNGDVFSEAAPNRNRNLLQQHGARTVVGKAEPQAHAELLGIGCGLWRDMQVVHDLGHRAARQLRFNIDENLGTRDLRPGR
jgi:hypothetical protein